MLNIVDLIFKISTIVENLVTVAAPRCGKLMGYGWIYVVKIQQGGQSRMI